MYIVISAYLGDRCGTSVCVCMKMQWKVSFLLLLLLLTVEEIEVVRRLASTINDCNQWAANEHARTQRTNAYANQWPPVNQWQPTGPVNNPSLT